MDLGAEGPGGLEVLLGLVQLAPVDGEQAGHDPDDDGGEPPHIGVIHREAGLGFVPTAQLVEEARGQAVEEQGRDLELGGAAEVGRGRGERDHLVAPPVLGQDAPEVEVRAGHVGDVPLCSASSQGDAAGEGPVGVAGRPSATPHGGRGPRRRASPPPGRCHRLAQGGPAGGAAPPSAPA
jgi:hypothetical protein